LVDAIAAANASRGVRSSANRAGGAGSAGSAGAAHDANEEDANEEDATADAVAPSEGATHDPVDASASSARGVPRDPERSSSAGGAGASAAEGSAPSRGAPRRGASAKDASARAGATSETFEPTGARNPRARRRSSPRDASCVSTSVATNTPAANDASALGIARGVAARAPVRWTNAFVVDSLRLSYA
jgi:hypothetical protein